MAGAGLYPSRERGYGGRHHEQFVTGEERGKESVGDQLSSSASRALEDKAGRCGLRRFNEGLRVSWSAIACLFFHLFNGTSDLWSSTWDGGCNDPSRSPDFFLDKSSLPPPMKST